MLESEEESRVCRCSIMSEIQKNEGSRSMWLRWDSFSHNYSFTHSQSQTHTHTLLFHIWLTHTPESLHFLLSNMILPLLWVSRNVTTLQRFRNTLGFIVRLWTILALIFIISWCKRIKSKVQFIFEKKQWFSFWLHNNGNVYKSYTAVLAAYCRPL